MARYKIPGVTICDSAKIFGIEKIRFGADTYVDHYSIIYANAPMSIGRNVYVASFSFISGAVEVEIGDYAGLFQGCRIYAGAEDLKDWGFGNPTIPDKFRNAKRAPVRIGRFATIGANSVVLPGVSIGEGATVGANSVVTRDLAPWAVYIGNRKVGERNRKGLMENYERYMAEMKTRE
ncbi:MAG: acyltransferase [Spirochaetes bacterium]|nr:MAG: acyltransferase [Spirochaetota bacterium]